MHNYDLNDILIEPASISEISSRDEVNPFDHNGFLPAIVSPMDTVISRKNYELFLNNNINVCLPRGERISINNFNVFYSFSLDDFIKKYVNGNKGTFEYLPKRVLIDIANGNMRKLLMAIENIKSKYGSSITIMAGNIANPQTYRELSNSGADFVRVGIGGGASCITSCQTSIGAPMGSLIRSCYFESLKLDKPAKIVADGGMKNYSDIITALALGADYVMIGSLFNKAIESAGDNYLYNKIKVSQKSGEWFYNHGFPIYKKFRGMSTKEVQKKWGKIKLRTSEGIIKRRKVEYTLSQWVNNFEDYLRSAMSYCGKNNLKDFIGGVNYNLITKASYERFNK